MRRSSKDHNSARARRTPEEKPLSIAPKSPEKVLAPDATNEGSSSLPSLFDGFSREQGAQMAQRCLLSALEWMHERASHEPAENQAAWRKQLGAVQAAMRFIRQDSLPAAASADRSPPGAIDPQRAKEFGARVRAARREAGLSRDDLALRAGLSLGTVRNVEAGSNLPNHATVLRLLAVKELALSSEHVPWQHTIPTHFGSSPNCWIAPGYDPLKLFADLFERLNSQGGSLEQTFAYLDHKSAATWFQISNQSQYASRYRAKTPIEQMAQRVIDETRHAKLDVIALGSGDGKQEVRLVQSLLDWAEERRLVADIRLFLIDVSQPLLSAALLHANAALEHRGVYVCAVQGNFHHWPQYRQFHYANERSHRRRVLCMFGNTVGNLDNESRFFQHTLVGLVPNDLLLVDLGLGYGSPDNPDHIRSRDPVLSLSVPETHIEWLSGPIWRYSKDVRHVTLSYQLDLTSQFPGAYTIDTLAKVQLTTGEERRFSVFRFRRYNAQRFAEHLRQLGWDVLVQTPFGPDPSQPVMSALLFRRIAEPGAKTEGVFWYPAPES